MLARRSRARRPRTVAALPPLAFVAVAACAGGARQAAPPVPPLTIAAPPTPPMAGASLALQAGGASPRARIRWGVTPGERAWVAPDGTLTLLEPGPVAVHVTDGWREGSLDLAVRTNPAARVVMQQLVVPHARVGDTVRVIGHVYDAEGVRVPEAPVTYGVVTRGEEPGAATVGADGRFVAHRPGIYTVLAECGRVSGRTVVIVEDEEDRLARELARRLQAGATTAAAGVPPRHHDRAAESPEHHPASAPGIDSAAGARTLAAVAVAAARTRRVVIDDADAAPWEGTTVTLDAHVWVDGDARPDTSARVLWASSDPARAYVSQRGRVAFLGAGWVTITATHGDVTTSRRFNVRPHRAVRLALRPHTPDAVAGRPVRFREDVWEPGAIPLTDARVNYAVIAHGVDGEVPATLTEQRVFTAWRPGVYTVLAEVGGVADKFTLLVRDPAMALR